MTTEPTPGNVPLSDQLGLSPARKALSRLVAAYEARQLLALNHTFGGTIAGISAEIERHHRLSRHAEDEFCRALVQAKMVLDAERKGKRRRPNNYCRVLAAIDMEKGGDPVAEIETLMALREKIYRVLDEHELCGDAETRIRFLLAERERLLAALRSVPTSAALTPNV